MDEETLIQSIERGSSDWDMPELWTIAREIHAADLGMDGWNLGDDEELLISFANGSEILLSIDYDDRLSVHRIHDRYGLVLTGQRVGAWHDAQDMGAIVDLVRSAIV